MNTASVVMTEHRLMRTEQQHCAALCFGTAAAGCWQCTGGEDCGRLYWFGSRLLIQSLETRPNSPAIPGKQQPPKVKLITCKSGIRVRN
jgi:hypothetical protein